MRLKVLLPTEVAVDEDVRKVVAEGEEGSFGLLPRHVDYASALVPGILIYETERGEERYVGVDEGVLVKCGPEVLVSTRRAIRSDNLEDLERTVAERFARQGEQERALLTATARLEADLVRRFFEMGKHGRA